jgi:SAM-dependent methyltransferase
MFNQYVQADIRKNRPTATVTEESLTNRFEVMLPPWLIQGQRVLDLGSALGAAGHWCLHHGATHYTGVEIQKSFADNSTQLLGSTYSADQFSIVNQDILQFVDHTSDQWDIVIAAGVVHGFFDPFGTIKKITDLSSSWVVIETLNLKESNHIPTIHLCNMNMVRYSDNNQPWQGITAVVGVGAFDLIMNECDFVRDGDLLYPARIAGSHDAYNDIMQWPYFEPSTQRFLARYKKTSTTKKSLETKIKHDQINTTTTPAIHDGVVFDKNNSVWTFDDQVAERFLQEALTNIPDYDRVIDLCVEIAQHKFDNSCRVVDVGSALGYTINKFVDQGFENVTGVESSTSMLKFAQHADRVVLSSEFPSNITADLILANWTLHFIHRRDQYLQDMFDSLNPGGAVVVTDKTTQSDLIKELYYDFKRGNGVSDEYIQQKEEKLKGYMTCYSVDWYWQQLARIGFKNIQVINSRLGFVTFYAEK